MRTDMKKTIVDCCNFATAPGKDKDIMTLSPEVDVIANTLYLGFRYTKNFS
jgi:hypothetical protein